MQTTEQAITEIEQAYLILAGRGQWCSLTRIAEMVDLTNEQMTEALRQLSRRDGVNVCPESNQKMLTQLDRDCAVWIGGQWKHLLYIEG
jgi:hypothetical protein